MIVHIGLIGGIGPAATKIYYTRLVDAFKAEGLSLSLTISHADFEVLAANAKAGDRDAQAEVFAKHLKALHAAGCDIALITALTGHFCFEETRTLSPVTLIDGIDVIDRYCSDQGIQTLGVLGSPPVMATHLFGMLKSVRTVVTQSGLAELGETYMAVAQSGVCTDLQRRQFFDIAAGLVEDQGAEAVLLAGTDLGLAFDGHAHPIRVIDALDLHVDALVSMAALQ